MTFTITYIQTLDDIYKHKTLTYVHTCMHAYIQRNAMTHNDSQWHTMSYNDTRWHTLTYTNIQCHTMTYIQTDTQWHTMTYIHTYIQWHLQWHLQWQKQLHSYRHKMSYVSQVFRHPAHHVYIGYQYIYMLEGPPCTMWRPCSFPYFLYFLYLLLETSS